MVKEKPKGIVSNFGPFDPKELMAFLMNGDRIYLQACQEVALNSPEGYCTGKLLRSCFKDECAEVSPERLCLRKADESDDEKENDDATVIYDSEEAFHDLSSSACCHIGFRESQEIALTRQTEGGLVSAPLQFGGSS